MSSAADGAAWTLLTGHGHVLVAIAKDPRARVRDLAREAGLTERTTQAIVADLEAGGYITRRRVGRRTEYVVHTARGFRDPSQDGLPVGPFLELLANPRPRETTAAEPDRDRMRPGQTDGAGQRPDAHSGDEQSEPAPENARR